ncbi:MAG: site-2 protease family protein [Spirochaetales bacterium]|nr:site-2 protease family protein [Spirochaetales bacterium]
MFSLLLAILGFGFLVFIHELGHFLVAKLFKVKVECFSIGMGPKVIGFKKGDTVYQIGAILMGGFCQFKQDALKDDLPEVLTRKKFELLSNALKNKISEEKLSEYYRKMPPKSIAISEFRNLTKDKENRPDAECLFDCYEEDNDVFVRKEDLSDKNIYVSVEYLESFGTYEFEYCLNSEAFATGKERKDFINLVYKSMNLRELKDSDSFFGVYPFKRLLVAFAGPFMNYIFAIILFSLIFAGARKEIVIPNKILLSDDVERKEASVSPAKSAGLLSGDRIISVNNHSIESFSELSEEMILAGTRSKLNIGIERNGEILKFQVQPEWDKNLMRPLLGVYFYQEPLLDRVEESKLAQFLNLQNGDKIVAVDGKRDLISTVSVERYLMNLWQTKTAGTVTVLRNNAEFDVNVDLGGFDEKDIFLCYYFEVKDVKGKNLFAACAEGFKESNKLIKITALSTYALIVKPKGDISRQVGGPIKIGYLMKNIADEGFSNSFLEGMRNFFIVLANISLALAFFNLLPLPALDGGYIVMSAAEMIMRKPIKIGYVYILNFIALMLLMGLGLFVAVMDIFYIIGH